MAHPSRVRGAATESRSRTRSAAAAGTDTREAISAAIAALTPMVREHAEHAEHDRVTHPAVIAAMVETGLFTLLYSSAEHGSADPVGFFDAVRTLAAACPSTGWVAAMLGAASCHVALLEPHARQEVWGSAPNALVTASHAPAGRLTSTVGGYLLDGQWPNVPAIEHCGWAALAALTTGPDGGPVGLATAVVPRAELALGDYWNTIGLRGTGSRSVTAQRVFVPAHLVHTSAQPTGADMVGSEPPPGHYPLAIIYSLAACIPVIGAVQGAFEQYLGRAGQRAAFSLAGARSVTDPAVQVTVARGLAEIDAAILQLERDAREATVAVAAGNVLTTELRLRTRRDQVWAIERALAALESLRRVAGAEAIREGAGIERVWRDVSTAAAHLVNQPDPALRLYGRWAFGLEVGDDMVIV
ncbi:flavin-dependent monooxygenase [Nocardia sp. NPDC059246]|uniref:flavin-dependent monooxygenase n=1 Tax=unclassified Nocardia TaxID=2637762 RepID=UPI00369D786C